MTATDTATISFLDGLSERAAEHITELVTDGDVRRMAVMLRDAVEDGALLPTFHEVNWADPDTETRLWLYAAEDAQKLGLTAERLEMLIEDDPRALRGFAQTLRSI